MNKLKGKRIVITGASSGIGKDVMIKLLDQGAVVFAVSKPNDFVDYIHANLRVGYYDISEPESLDVLFEQAISDLGSIDIYIANAGFAYYEIMGKADWNRIELIYKTNVFSTIYAAQKMKDLHQDNPYQFISTASAMAYIALPGYSLYSSTKAALRSFEDAYKYETNKDQLFQIVYPISTRTSFFKNAGNSPVPWPSQSSDVVAESIISGIVQKKRKIFPSKLFQVIMILDRIFPFVSSTYQHIEYKRLMKSTIGAKQI